MEPQPFGHGNSKRLKLHGDAGRASMEPQPFGHGNAVVLRKANDDARRFNGATAFRPWKQRLTRQLVSTYPPLQWSHSLSAMETPVSVGGQVTPQVASMEPQPFGHGNGLRGRLPGAVSGRFNGATAFRPWKPPPANPPAVGEAWLQWSHSLSAMETRRRCGDGALGFPASMEPQPFGHGNPVSGKCGSSKRKRFNGATAFRPWKLRSERLRTAWDSGFNGATAFRPWKRPKPPRVNLNKGSLQWSHSLSAMETRIYGHSHLWSRQLQWSHSLSAMETFLA